MTVKDTPATARYTVISDADGVRYQFYCDLSGSSVCITRPVGAHSTREALLTAWENEGRQHFNQCHRCGRWVIDLMYNADVCACVQCAAWEEQPPRFCKHCGAKVQPGKVVCEACQKPLNY